MTGVTSGSDDRGSDREKPISVLLVDDQPLLRSGFSMILSTEPDIEVVGVAENGQRAVEAVEDLRPDLVLMDVQMPVLDGIEATRAIVAQAARDGVDAPKIIMLTTFDRDDYLFDALAAGASGFLLKNADAEHLLDGIRTVYGGLALLAPEVTRRVIAAAHQPADPSPTPETLHPGPPRPGAPQPGAPQPGPPQRTDGILTELTSRESEVLTLLAHGLNNAEIAAKLFLSEATVKTHVSNVLTKLGVRDRVQAVIAAYRGGMVPPLG